uniref:Uncharacterized protein n=1 Tax=Trypanosoma vivax (strain Y486) TaxID=1055687 RepID=G0TSL6_TRYVY|nr:hypothetical protein TVY486_0301330 [Trypanosoma vivax Y486]
MTEQCFLFLHNYLTVQVIRLSQAYDYLNFLLWAYKVHIMSLSSSFLPICACICLRFHHSAHILPPFSVTLFVVYCYNCLGRDSQRRLKDSHCPCHPCRLQRRVLLMLLLGCL